MPNKPKYRIEEEPEEKPKRGKGRPRRPIPTLEGQTLEGIQKRVDARYSEFLEDFDESALTRGDLDQIRNMAFMSVTSEENNKKLLAATAGLLSLTPNEFGALTKSVNDLSKEIRLIQDSLGIDRKTRIASESSEMEQYLPKLHKEALDLIYKRGLYLCCLKCRATEAQTEIHHGLLLYHFMEEEDVFLPDGTVRDNNWGMTFRCFRCGDEQTIAPWNYQQYRPSAIDAIMPPEEKADEDDEDAED
jgi:hypothetical protein